MSGLSWFGVLSTLSEPAPSAVTQAQPEPNRPEAAAVNCSFNFAKSPKDRFTASAKAPVGSPPALGPMSTQNMLWFQCPPPLLRTAVRTTSGTAPRFLSSPSRSDAWTPGAFSSAACRLFTYPWWCLVWRISMGRASLPQPGDRAGEQRQRDHDGDHDVDVPVHPGNVAPQEVADEQHAPHPGQPAHHVVGDEVAIAHLRHPCHHRRERPNDRHEPCEHDRLPPVLLVERMSAIQVLLVEEQRLLTREDARARAAADRVPHRVPGDRK